MKTTITITKVLVVLGLIGIIIGYKSITIIETGNVGVKLTMGQINPVELKPGVNFAVPLIQRIETVFTKTIMINYSEDQKKDTEELYYESTLKGEDKTGLEMGVDMIVEVNPMSDKMADMFIEVGRAGFDKKVLQPIRGATRKVLGQFNAEIIMSQRKEVEQQLKVELQDIFNSNPYYKLENVQLKKIYLPTRVKEAIERVQLAKQEAKTKEEMIKANIAVAQSQVETAKGQAEAVRQQALGEADAVRERVKAEADAIKIKAEAEAAKIEVEAKAKAKANTEVAASLSELLLRQNQIEAWKEGGSKVPNFISGEAGNNSLFLIDTKNFK